jgi:uncharacterized protein YjiS (DUF1127 family)
MSSTVAVRHGFAPWGAVMNKIDGAITVLRVRHERRRAAHELALMNDRELADMGLTRGDIYRLAHGFPVER